MCIYIVGLQNIMCFQLCTPKFEPVLRFVVRQSQLLEEKRPFFKIQVGLYTKLNSVALVRERYFLL
jgi:hypothetical protein